MNETAQQFAFAIALARQSGELQGRVTSQTLASLFPPYITDSSPTTAGYVAKANAYLANAAAQAGKVTPTGRLDQLA
jgi:hypothetical protein